MHDGGVVIRLGDKSVLYFGDGSPSGVHGLAAGGELVVVDPSCSTSIQLARQFDVVWIDRRTIRMAAIETCRAVLDSAVAHLSPGGLLVGVFDQRATDLRRQFVQMCDQFALERAAEQSVDDGVAVFRRRTDRFTVHDLVHQARSKICRIEARDLFERLCGDHPPTVVDTRTNTDRERFGVIRGAVHVPRTVLEWHLDPSSGYRHPAVTSTDQSLVVVCNGGYSSSLAAVNLMLLGFTRVSDLVGGHQAWKAAGLPVEHPDHSSLDF